MSFQDKAHNFVSQLDKELSKYPALNNLEKQTNVPKVYVVGGLSFIYFFLIFLNFGGQLLTNIAGFVLPGYYTFQALFTVSRIDDTQYLTYWVIFAFLSVVEAGIAVTYWLPFYYIFKFVLLMWLGLPQFNGANVIFRSLLQPLLAKQFTSVGSASANLRAKADSIGLGDKSL